MLGVLYSLIKLDLRDAAPVGQGLALDGLAHLLGDLTREWGTRGCGALIVQEL